MTREQARSMGDDYIEGLKRANSSIWCHTQQHQKCSWPRVLCVCECHRASG